MIAKEEIERLLSLRSDDFGHDCQALLLAESDALQKVGESHLELYSAYESEQRKAQVATYLIYEARKERDEARAELKKFVKFDAFLKDDGDVSPEVYKSAVKGRQDFRNALRAERAKSARLVEAFKHYPCTCFQDGKGICPKCDALRPAIPTESESIIIEKEACVNCGYAYMRSESVKLTEDFLKPIADQRDYWEARHEEAVKEREELRAKLASTIEREEK